MLVDRSGYVAPSSPSMLQVAPPRYLTDRARAVAEIVEGLSATQKWINPRFFYDRLGSQLFEQITRTDDYYVARAETEILTQQASDIAATVGAIDVLIEPGAGNCRKAETLMAALQPHVCLPSAGAPRVRVPRAYVPLDIEPAILNAAARRLRRRAPWLHCRPITAAFDDLRHLHGSVRWRRLLFFPGSTIGNFHRADAIDFLCTVVRIVGRDGGLLTGVDLEKSPHILDRAYNDRDGITANFNLNMLSHINALTGSDFELERFTHLARYDSERKRVDMFLRSNCRQRVQIDGRVIALGRGELIHTESSYKYSTERFAALASQAGLARAASWYDSQQLFSLHYFVATEISSASGTAISAAALSSVSAVK